MADGPAEPWAGAGFPVGFRIAGYRLTEQIGRGGMAIVYRAQDERLNREVALKVLAPSQAADGAFRQRFIQESHAAAAVDDPNIIPVFEAGEAAGVLFIAMRLVRGGDVRSLVRRDGQLTVQRAVRIMAAAASALDTAHAAGLVHRDIKPANMLLDVRPGRPDHVYVSDFGLSKSSLGSGGLTGSGQFLGTVDYAAPEQLSGKHVDGRADQYALGCTAYELLCGQPPYRRDQGLAVIYAHMTAPPHKPTRVRPDLPAEADDVFRKVLAKDPAARYGSCQEFADALRQALGLGSQAGETGAALTAVTGEAPALAGSSPGAGGQGATGPAGSGGAAHTVLDGQPTLGAVALAGSSLPGPLSVPPEFTHPGSQIPAMRRRLALAGALLMLVVAGVVALILAGPWSGGPAHPVAQTPSVSPSPSPPAGLRSLRIIPDAIRLTPGQTQVVRLTGRLSDGSAATAVTLNKAVWTADNGTVAAVSPAGVVTGLTAGETRIRARIGSVRAIVLVTVAGPSQPGAGPPVQAQPTPRQPPPPSSPSPTPPPPPTPTPTPTPTPSTP